MRAIVSCALACLLVFASQARADDPAGVYLRVAGTVAYDRFAPSERSREGSVSLGVNGSIGYRTGPHFAVEVEGEWLDTIETHSFVGTDQDFDIWLTTLNLKGFYPIWRFHPFVLAGAGVMHAEVESDLFFGSASASDTDFVGRIGVGSEVVLAGGLALMGDVVYAFPTGDLDGLDFIRIGWGFLYRF